MYSETTHHVTVTVMPTFLDQQSQPESGQYVWSYHVRIENRGPVTLQLRRRFWHITDQEGRAQFVEGDGVVGFQPVLRPGEGFEYTSATQLATPSGMMWGHYKMVTELGEKFKVTIPAFSLDCPNEKPNLN